MNALVISGGGSKGAFAGGIAEYLIREYKKEYQLFVGTSTGSLLAPLLAIGEIERVKKIYTTVNQKDIFSVCPFIIKKENGLFRTRINHFAIVKQFFKGQKTFGNSENLRALIKRTFTEKDFRRLKIMGKEVVVTVANLTEHIIEYKSSNDYGYEDFCDWVWASANFLPFMSLMVKNGQEYGDGGFGDLIPIQEAILQGATCVDVIVLRPVVRTYDNPPSRNAFNVMNITYDFMMNQIAKDDLLIGKLEAASRRVDIHFFHTPRILTEQSFIFDADTMKQWWQEGFELFRNKIPESHCLDPKK